MSQIPPLDRLNRAEARLRSEQFDHRTTRRSLTVYRYVALAGWLAFLTVVLMQPAKADTLPRHSIACVDEPAWSEQVSLMHAGIPELAEGCVFTLRDFAVRVETRTVFSGSSVWVDLQDKEQLVWVDGGVLLP